MAKVQIDEPCEKIRSLFQGLCWTRKLKLAKTLLQVSYTDSSHPCDHHVFWADVVGRVRGTCCGKCSESMLWDVFGAYVLGHVVGSCFGLCSRPMFWDVFGAHVLGKALGLYSEMYLGVM